MIITQPEAYRMLALYQAVKLESRGLKRRGRSATAIARELLAMPRNTKSAVVLACLEDIRQQLTTL